MKIESEVAQSCPTLIYSAIKKNEIMPFAAIWMDLETIILSEVSQRKTSITYHMICEISKIVQINLFTNRIRLTGIETNL